MDKLNFSTFWGLSGQLIKRLMGERAHVEVVFSMRDGEIKLVRVNRTFEPQHLSALLNTSSPGPGS